MRTLDDVLQALARGELDVEAAKSRLVTWPVEALEDYSIDHHRALRQGIPEVIFGGGKDPEQVANIAEKIAAEGPLLVTRATVDAFDAVKAKVPGARYEEHARCILAADDDVPKMAGKVCLVSAGTSDRSVTEEARVCATYFGLNVEVVQDIGVAGVHRVLRAQDTLTDADVIIVIAGMDGALASVVGGLAAAPIIAVPTSVGYGATFGGVSALLSMLTSCAAGVTVVNIDNGFGAARAARRYLRT